MVFEVLGCWFFSVNNHRAIFYSHSNGTGSMKEKITVVLVLFLVIIQSPLLAQEISPRLTGTNVWYYDPGEVVWGLVEGVGPQTIRIGGHAYDRTLPSKETLLEWIQKIQATGAEAVLQVSQYGTAEEAAELVRFFNVEMKEVVAPVKYWNIGNEPWLQAGRPDFSTIGPKVEAYFKPFAAAMKEVDSSILIFGPNFSDYYDEPINDLFGGKNDITGKVPGKDYFYVDGLAFHRYPQGSGDPAVEGADDFLERIMKVRKKVDEVNLLHNRTGDNALRWGIGEFNSKGGREVHTWGNGQMFGAVYGFAMEYGAEFATSWSMFEHGGRREGTDFSLIDGTNMTPRASYRHMEFVSKFFRGKFLKGVSNDDDLLVYGAQDGEQTSVMIMNRGFGEAKAYTLFLSNNRERVPGLNIVINGSKEVLYKGKIQERATQVIIFKEDSITTVNYTSADFENERPPQYETVEN